MFLCAWLAYGQFGRWINLSVSLQTLRHLVLHWNLYWWFMIRRDYDLFHRLRDIFLWQALKQLLNISTLHISRLFWDMQHSWFYCKLSVKFVSMNSIFSCRFLHKPQAELIRLQKDIPASALEADDFEVIPSVVFWSKHLLRTPKSKLYLESLSVTFSKIIFLNFDSLRYHFMSIGLKSFKSLKRWV